MTDTPSPLRVIDVEPSVWFLFEDGDRLLLDVNCSLGAGSYTVTIALDEGERSRYEAGGPDYLTSLAARIHNSVPAADHSTSPYKDRNLANDRELRGALSAAVREAGLGFEIPFQN